MKTTDHFQRTIQAYLEEEAATNPLFTPHYRNPEKQLCECIQYILNTVHKSGYNGFHPSEIHSMALHYYMEAEVNVDNPINCHVVVNHEVILTEQEQAQAKQEAIKRAENEAYQQMKQPKRKPQRVSTVVQPTLSLFDL